jgi:hypothetical protein
MILTLKVLNYGLLVVIVVEVAFWLNRKDSTFRCYMQRQNLTFSVNVAKKPEFLVHLIKVNF